MRLPVENDPSLDLSVRDRMGRDIPSQQHLLALERAIDMSPSKQQCFPRIVSVHGPDEVIV